MTDDDDNGEWVTENTFEDHMSNVDFANAVLENIDDVVIALHKLGWKIVCQEDADRRWPMCELTPHCPGWAESVEDMRETIRREQAGEIPKTLWGLNPDHRADWQRQHFKVVEPEANP